MTDLDRAIRARLGLVEPWDERPPGFVQGMHDALLAVLDLHEHIHEDGPKPGDGDDDYVTNWAVNSTPLAPASFGCTHCHHEGYGSVRGHGWCSTVRTIAEKLGVEHD